MAPVGLQVQSHPTPPHAGVFGRFRKCQSVAIISTSQHQAFSCIFLGVSRYCMVNLLIGGWGEGNWEIVSFRFVSFVRACGRAVWFPSGNRTQKSTPSFFLFSFGPGNFPFSLVCKLYRVTKCTKCCSPTAPNLLSNFSWANRYLIDELINRLIS